MRVCVGGGGVVYTRFLKQNFLFKEGSIKVNCSYEVITEIELVSRLCWISAVIKLLFMYWYLFPYKCNVSVSHYTWFMARLVYVH
jgi:hypothetical protein